MSLEELRQTDTQINPRNPTNYDRFKGRADVYQKYRQRYTPELIDALRSGCGLAPEWRVADIGAGTGMLAELFLENGNAVVAVEPSDEMRAVCEQLKDVYPQLKTLGTTAEETGIPGGTIDLIAIGRAFHWFDRARCRPEFLRILRKGFSRDGGWVAITYNSRKKSDEPVSRDLEQIMLAHSVDYAEVREKYDTEAAALEFLRGGDPQSRKFLGQQTLTYDELEGQMLSLSVMPQPGHPKFAGMRGALEEYFARYERDGRVTMPTETGVIYGRLEP